jgi:hypothetical protein
MAHISSVPASSGMRTFRVRQPAASSVQYSKDWSSSGRGCAPPTPPAESTSSMRRHSRQNRSVWLAVAESANSSSADSQSGAAMRVSARTFAYDSRPAANAASIRGRTRSARATRTCSRAVPGARPHCQANHSAHERMPTPNQPFRSSNSATSRNQAAVAAANRTAPAVIAHASSGNGEPEGCSVSLFEPMFGSYGPGLTERAAQRRAA